MEEEIQTNKIQGKSVRISLILYISVGHEVYSPNVLVGSGVGGGIPPVRNFWRGNSLFDPPLIAFWKVLEGEGELLDFPPSSPHITFLKKLKPSITYQIQPCQLVPI